MSTGVSVERQGAVMVLHLDDGKVNALSFDALATINAALDEIEADTSIGAVVLHGRPGRFCAGFDLAVIHSGDPAAIVELMCAGGELFARLYGLPVPVVAACTGHALAAGAFLLLASDFRVGADLPCKVGLNEVAIGLPMPAWGSTLVTERLAPTRRQRSLLLAELTGPTEACEVGFLDVVVPEGDVLSVAMAHAAQYAEYPRHAYAGTVRSARGEVLKRLSEQIARDRSR
jgi:enoyl-CoA hydratase